MTNNHVFLLNPQSDNPTFNRQRGFKPNEKQEEEEPRLKYILEFQKERLRSDSAALYTQRKLRNEARTIQFPEVIDLVRIYFFTIFNNDLKGKFFTRYGLSPVEYSHFNKTVVFEVLDRNLFNTFLTHIQEIVNSPDGTSYENKPFNLIALILNFEFIGSRKRLFTSRESGILLTLMSSANRVSILQKKSLFTFLREQNAPFSYNESTPDILEIKNLSRAQTQIIANNFDIVKAITSTRVLKVRPGVYGNVRRDFGFTVSIPDDLVTVGVIDTGITRIDPLKNLIADISFDHTGYGAFWDEAGHGTAVSGLIALGDDFQTEIKTNYIAKAKIAVIKAIHNTNDDINIPQLLTDIRSAKRVHGIRLFNMSLNIPFAKKYNDGYSQFAYELDKLAYEEDILIFISVGNIDSDYLQELIEIDAHPDHEYPTFFYKTDSTSTSHSCRNTNISEPAESLNNISVGALAGNLEEGDNSDATPQSLYPAYYSRKFHFDYSQPINATPLKKNQRNKYLNKPDLIFEGGDLFSYNSGMEVLRSPLSDSEKFYGRTCGTSLATPLVASYAAQILRRYPILRTQTVKALLINSATYYKISNLPHFRSSSETLLKSMIGFGRPQKDKLLTTGNNSIVFIVENEVSIGQILTIPINLPSYLKNTDNKLKFDISLCYSFKPLKDNHLNYLPLYISFNLIQNIDIETVANADQGQYGIKAGFSWSEDHFGIENRLFSNAQSTSYTLQPRDLRNIGDSIALGVRCLSKSEIPESHLQHTTSTSHKISIVIRISELTSNNVGNQLYSEMIACNSIKNIGEATSTIEVDLDI